MKQYYSTEEAAEKLKTTPFTIRKYIREGYLQASKVGKRFIISDEQIENLLKNREVKKKKSTK